ncbi:ribosomal protein S16 [Panus rudis PR-1116 ss-1]|nr:ribosomal protein S16 [Panus rudis PR-1116 ss-1]
MAVRLRFAMHGPRHNRIFHLVAIDQRSRRNAKPIETLAIFNPRLQSGQETKTVEWSVPRIRYWLREGAQPSPSVVRLLTMGGILSPNSRYHRQLEDKETKKDVKNES